MTIAWRRSQLFSLSSKTSTKRSQMGAVKSGTRVNNSTRERRSQHYGRERKDGEHTRREGTRNSHDDAVSPSSGFNSGGRSSRSGPRPEPPPPPLAFDLTGGIDETDDRLLRIVLSDEASPASVANSPACLESRCPMRSSIEGPAKRESSSPVATVR